ncbi:hypothetical protein VQ042_09225 [Aurantimonas sp. A2-1-M11]|uniref:hypothetical protein n=1 Tax=Aurantimonas sp. A2-1-M11 TaxID=3113712 RepID=UPI002F94AB38
MAARAAHEDRTYKVTEAVDLGEGLILPEGTYPGRLQWTEFSQVNGPPRIVSQRFVLPLSAAEVKGYGGKLGRTQKLREVDISKLVANGLIVEV